MRKCYCHLLVLRTSCPYLDNQIVMTFFPHVSQKFAQLQFQNKSKLVFPSSNDKQMEMFAYFCFLNRGNNFCTSVYTPLSTTRTMSPLSLDQWCVFFFFFPLIIHPHSLQRSAHTNSLLLMLMTFIYVTTSLNNFRLFKIMQVSQA